MSMEEDLRVERLKEQERNDAALAKKLSEEDTVQPTRRGVVVSTQIARDEEIARQKQNLYFQTPTTNHQTPIPSSSENQSLHFPNSNNSTNLRQITSDEKLAREKNSQYQYMNYTIDPTTLRQIEEDEKLARQKQSLYMMNIHGGLSNLSLLDPGVAQQIESDKKLALQKQNAYTLNLGMPSPGVVGDGQNNQNTSARPVQFNNTLSQLPTTLGNELAQFSKDEDFATNKQNLYMAQLGDLYDQIDRDEHLAEDLIIGRAEGMSQGFFHQVSIHNMNCKCLDTSSSNSDHIFKVHDKFCACKRTHRFHME